MKKQTAKTKGEDHGKDIIKIILEDHKALKRLIKIMKNTDHDLDVRERAYKEFVPLLIAHAKPEEQVLYEFMRADKALREESFEGEVEHGLADQMAEEAKRTDDDDILSAKIKVLAELVEHHIEEEEDSIFPDFKKHSEKNQRVELGDQYLTIKAKYDSGEEIDSPSEKKLPKKPMKNQNHRSISYN